ncbi:hypothetical protein EH165_02500 [Nakamurella antarctica]|uniref:Uncharacterized protein n=1 Tax=Nakamurella antarctica TaxID=1902245 RepID=A0A3G8ZRR5_9ACTN|nr:hypothetical protein [Nakamurella antarctica]AZI57194.1 hypothetical protein EH165_02500 [Nakamurella antarctica]
MLIVFAGLAIPGTTDLRVIASAVQFIGFACLAWRFGQISTAESSRSYSRPIPGALVAVMMMVPGAFFSIERVAMAVVVVAALAMPELWRKRNAGRASVAQ